MLFLGWQCRAARGALGWKKIDLQKHSGISIPTIVRFEDGKHVSLGSTMSRLQETFEEAGIVFTESGLQMERSRTADGQVGLM